MARPGRGDSTRKTGEHIPVMATGAARLDAVCSTIANGMGISGDV
jgi:hypothetical protein